VGIAPGRRRSASSRGPARPRPRTTAPSCSRRAPRRRGVGEDAGAEQVAELADPAADHAGGGAVEAADVGLAGAGAVLAVAVVGEREAGARAQVEARGGGPGAHAQRLLQRRVAGRAAAERAPLQARAVERAEPARRRPLVRHRRGGVPRGALAPRLRERARVPRRAPGREVLHRREAVLAERVAHEVLPEPVAARPGERLEAVPAPARVPDGLVGPLERPVGLLAGGQQPAA
jgi:hypothetical protein